MKRSKFFDIPLLPMALILLLQACAVPQPVSRLTPVEEEYEWLNGTENILFPEQEGIQVELQYIRSTPTQLLFQVGVRNLSGESTLLEPSQCTLTAMSQDYTTELGQPARALDPESELLRLDLRASREQAEQSNEAAMELLSQGLNLASDVASIGQEKDPVEQQNEEQERQQRREDYEISQAESEIRLQSLDDQRYYWANRALRKTTLKPGYETRGTVFFPRQNDADYLKVTIRIGQTRFSAIYRQRLFKKVGLLTK